MIRLSTEVLQNAEEYAIRLESKNKMKMPAFSCRQTLNLDQIHLGWSIEVGLPNNKF